VLGLIVILLLFLGCTSGQSSSASLDSDGDGLTDEQEAILKTNPYQIDSDNDGLNDKVDPNPLVPEAKERKTTSYSKPTETPKPASPLSPPAGPIETEYGYADPILEDAKPYLEAIDTEDIEFRRKASSIIGNCPSGDKECQVNGIFRYIVENFKYYSDPRRDEFVQTPLETERVKGGDCEDLTILLNTYLENLGIKTYLVLTPTHAYSLACGLDIVDLPDYIADSLTEQIAEDLGQGEDIEVITKDGLVYSVQRQTQTFSLGRGQIYYYGGAGGYLESPVEILDIVYSISSSRPLDIYIVPSQTDYELLADGRAFTHYPSCQKQNILSVSDECSIDRYGGIVLVNTDGYNSGTVSLDLKFYYGLSIMNEFFRDKEISYYQINGENCVVLDATTGEYGYPGYDANLEGEKIAIDPVTHEYEYLEG
jgi:hypothetical protein